MAGPFYNNIKGTTAGTPGTGAFTPNAASAGYLAWSTVPTGWWGLVRYEDGSAWELQYSYWNGTTLSRAASTQFVSSSTGSALTLTSSATAALVVDVNSIEPNMVGSIRTQKPNGSNTTLSSLGLNTANTFGTAANAALASTNALTTKLRVTYTSATTANATCGLTGSGNGAFFVSNTAGLGGGEVGYQFGISGTIPTGLRVAIGANGNITSFSGMTTNPSTITATDQAQFIKDSGDTNLQMATCNATTCTKVDTGIALVSGGLYEAVIWQLPGSNTTYFLLVRSDTGEIFYKSTSTTCPTVGFPLTACCIMGLSATTGTAAVLNFIVRTERNGW